MGQFEGTTTNDSLQEFTLQPFEFRNLSISFPDLLQQMIKDDSIIEIEPFYFIYENQTNDNLSGCTVQDRTMRCKRVDIFEVAESIPPTINHLDISNSPVQILRLPIFKNLTNLTELQLTNNSIQYVTSKLFEGLEQLQLLNLSYNNIRALTKQAFHACPNLRTIDLSRNRIISMNFIPMALSSLKNLSVVIFSHNNIKRIMSTNMDALKDSPVRYLDFSFCNLFIIERGSLRFLKNLERLNLAANPMNEESLLNVTADLPSIRLMNLERLLRLRSFPVLAMSALENSSLSYLDLSNNVLHYLPNNSFGFMPNLAYLRLFKSEIDYIEDGAFDRITSLKVLDISSNNLKSPPSAIKVLNNLEILYMNKENKNNNYHFNIPEYFFSNITSLRALVLNENNLGVILRYDFHNLINLRVLLMASCNIGHISKNSFETLTSLEVLDLSNNQIVFLVNDTLTGLHNLKAISLRNNNFFIGSRDNPFVHTHSLEKMYFSNNKVKFLKPGIFSNMPNLTLINLQNNQVIPWNGSIFNGSVKVPIKFILSNNRISRVTPTMLNDFKGIEEIDLSYNPFDCSDCDMKEFKTWLLNNENESDPLFYLCSSPEDLIGLSVLSSDVEFEHCLPEVFMLSLVIGLSVLAILLLVLLILIIRFKWYLRYWWFHLHSTFRRYSTSSDVSEFQFDAFVSYNSVDVAWVAQELLPNLENHHSNFRLCIHDRDFEVGRLITENILDSIDRSRKVILVLTESFVKSEWCLFELHVAQHQLFYNARDALILIQVGPIDKNCLSKNLKYLMKTRSLVIWPDDPDKKNEFWDRLHKLITT